MEARKPGLVLAALILSILVSAAAPPTVVDRAWRKAAEIAKITCPPPRPPVLLIKEPRFLVPVSEARLCGLTWRWWEEKNGKFVQKVKVEVYGADVWYIGTVHEFLHVLLGTPGQLATEDEVMAVWPYECPLVGKGN